jgi:hypothetical protein
MTRYRHTGMHENILLVLERNPGLTFESLFRAASGHQLFEPTEAALRAYDEFQQATLDLIRAERVRFADPAGVYYLSERPQSRLRRFLLSFPGIPRYGARRSQNASHERNR